jgi:flagellar FliL protein
VSGTLGAAARVEIPTLGDRQSVLTRHFALATDGTTFAHASRIMSDNAKEEAETAAEAPKKSKMPIIVMAVGVLSLAGAGGVVFLGNKPAKAEKPAKAHGAEGEHGEEAEAEEEEGHASGGHGAATGAFNQKLEPFIANLENDDGEMHYIKCTIIVELPNEAAKEKLDKKMPRIRQDVLLYLSGLTLAQTNGGEAKRKVREGLDAVVKTAGGKGFIKSVFVVELVVQ